MMPDRPEEFRDQRWIGDHASAELHLRLSAAVAAVRGRGVHVDGSARVLRWLGALAQFTQFAEADRRGILQALAASLQNGTWHHPHRDSFRALVDSRLFIEIVEQLLPDLVASDLRDLVSGNYHPEHDRPGNRARDREFELFAAAICRRAGLPTRLGEPDIVVEFEGTPVSLAAKRLSSRKRVRANLQKAEAQITTAGRPGIVVVDATRILDPRYVVVTHARHARLTVAGPLAMFIERDVGGTLSAARNPLVIGLLIRVALPLVSEGFRFGTYEHWSMVGIEGADSPFLKRFLSCLSPGFRGT